MAGQQLFVTNTLGGYTSCPKLSKKLWAATAPLQKFRQFVDFKEAWGKQKGESVLFDRYSRISTAGGTIAETSTVPRHNIVYSQGTLTIAEYTNAVGYTSKLELLADYNPMDPLHQALRWDMAATLDAAVAAQFQDSLAKYVCITGTTSTLTTNGTASATATSDLNRYHIQNCVDQLQKWNVEPFDDGMYAGIGSVAAIRGIKDDTASGGWVDAVRYSGAKQLFTGEVGEFAGVRFVQENSSLSSVIGNGSAHGEAVIFGKQACIEAVASPEEIQYDTPRDFGRDRAVRWVFYGGFRLTWCQLTGDTTSSFSTANGWVPHVIHVTSL